jgi:hypothetical protein
MAICHECGERLPAEPDRTGARCPYCREPLYDERPGRRRRPPEDGQCAVHAENPALGTCARCGNYLCAVCRTRWRERWLCAACVDLALERRDAAPAEESAHLRQSLLALGLGVLSWVIFLGGFAMAGAGFAGGSQGLMILGGFTLFVGPLPAAVGLGQAIAAIRARGDHMILATLGLVLSGVNVGVFIGIFSFGIGLQI